MYKKLLSSRTDRYVAHNLNLTFVWSMSNKLPLDTNKDNVFNFTKPNRNTQEVFIKNHRLKLASEIKGPRCDIFQCITQSSVGCINFETWTEKLPLDKKLQIIP